MAIDKSEFQIHIGSSADLSGLDATIAKLQGQIEATKMLGKDTAALEAQLQKVRQTKIEASLAGFTKGAKDAGEGAKKAGEGMEEMIGGHHGIHAIGHALNQAIPGMMQFTRFLTSGFTAAIGVALLAFEYLKSKTEEFSKMLDDLNTGPGARGEWAEKMADAVRSAAVEEATFNERLAETATAQETLAASTDKLIAAQKQRVTDAKTVGAAQKALDEARVALAEKLGQITPEQAVMIKLQIDDADFKRQLEAEKAGIQAELNARKQEQRSLSDREPALGSAMHKASDKALAAANAQAKNDAKLDQATKNRDALADSDKAAEGVIDKYGGRNLMEKGLGGVESLLRAAMGQGFTTADYESVKKAIETQQQNAGLRAGYTKEIGQETAKKTPLAEAAAVAKQQAEKAKADYEAAAKDSHDIVAVVEKLKADLAAAVAKDAALERIHAQQSQVAAASAHADEVKRVNAARAAKHDAQPGAPRSLEALSAQPGPEIAPAMPEPNFIPTWSAQDRMEQLGRAQETGPNAGLDAADAVATGRRIISTLYAAHGPQAADQMAELHRTLNEIVGFLQNHTSNVQSQRNDLQDVRQKLNDLESRMNLGRGTL